MTCRNLSTDSSSTESQKQEEQAQPPSASSNGSNVEANGPAMLEPAHLTRSNNGYPNSASSSSVQTGLRMSSSCAAIKSSGSYMPLHQPNRSLPLRPAPPLPRRRSSSIVPPQQSVLDKNARNNKDAPSNRKCDPPPRMPAQSSYLSASIDNKYTRFTHSYTDTLTRFTRFIAK
uniref:Uncharacterized protein n=1 Tax=Trichogramma kaykai TaxID=54128 RepID=A0ABD2WNC2_9HYME